MTALALALILLGAQGPGAAVEVRAVVRPDSVRLGEPFSVVVAVGGAAEAEVIFPDFPESEAISVLGPPEIAGAGSSDRVARYQAVAWELGELRLPDAEVRVLTEGVGLWVPLPPLSVRVVSVLPAGAGADTLAWRPPADVVGANWSLAERLAGVGLALALLLAGAALLRRRGAARPLPVAAALTPRERALDALSQLAASGMAEAGELKAYYSALSEIMRGYLAELDGRWGLDLTTTELVEAVVGAGVDWPRVERLGSLLVVADRVKFARRRPSHEQAARTLESARRWISGYEESPA